MIITPPSIAVTLVLTLKHDVPFTRPLFIIIVSPPAQHVLPASLLVSCSPLEGSRSCHNPTLCLPIFIWCRLHQYVLPVLWPGVVPTALGKQLPPPLCSIRQKIGCYGITYLLSRPTVASFLLPPQDYVMLTASAPPIRSVCPMGWRCSFCPGKTAIPSVYNTRQKLAATGLYICFHAQLWRLSCSRRRNTSC